VPAVDIEAKSAAAANLLGLDPLIGLFTFSAIGVAGISMLTRNGREDVATALSLAMLLGLGALFLSWTDQYSQGIFALLFGQILGISSSKLGPTLALSALTIAFVVALFRPLLLSSVSPELGEVRGVPPRGMQILFLAILAFATAMALPVVGALMVFSLMVGPASAARAFTIRPLFGIFLSAAISVVTVWGAISLAFLSDWPVGFFVGILSAVAYAVGRIWMHLLLRNPIAGNMQV
jgi:zinc/manganese transport system permease protein